MGNRIVETLATLLKELQKYGTAESVIGKEIRIGDITVVPITKISLGVGAGGGMKEKKESEGSGGGGGLKVEPIGFLVIQKDQVSLLNIGKRGPLDTISEQVPTLINKWMEKHTRAGEKRNEKNK